MERNILLKSQKVPQKNIMSFNRISKRSGDPASAGPNKLCCGENTNSKIMRKMWQNLYLKHYNQLQQLLPALSKLGTECRQHFVLLPFFEIQVLLRKALIGFKEFFFPGFPVSSFIRFHSLLLLRCLSF